MFQVVVRLQLCEEKPVCVCDGTLFHWEGRSVLAVVKLAFMTMLNALSYIFNKYFCLCLSLKYKELS